MQHRDMLFKLYHFIRHEANILVRHKRSPVQLRLVAKARHQSQRNRGVISEHAQHTHDSLVARYYID